ncbi:uncharacterized protein BYT42DRAFT_505429 [Radiomyces spectabilis]|uniref:uncharacterized protein n=1 Tax=Radiomyces spectabilis TaxID=64574 RepID=UPI00221E740A|nr:uncharacterized protein BYT42DRAFT_505429 [Radiomyces spectabilis]KAI8365919.1 hypothetical protein BYT42DRAFT_505429 [Radiomyces spectabilis]
MSASSSQRAQSLVEVESGANGSLPKNGEQHKVHPDKYYQPRRIAGRCDLTELLKYLTDHRKQLGPARIFRSLRAALYTGSEYDPQKAWRIYEAMVQLDVVHLMRINHYGQLLNILKYETGPNGLKHMLVVADQIKKAHKDGILSISSMCCSQILYGMARHGEVREAINFIRYMREIGVTPSTTHYTSLALASSRRHDLEATAEAAQLMLEGVQKDGVVLETRAYSVMVYALSQDTTTDGVMKFLKSIKRANAAGPSNDDSSYYNVHIYTSLISSLAQKGDAANAKRLFDEMKRHGIWPNSVTYAALLDAYGRAGDFDSAVKLLNHRSKDRINQLPNPVMATSILVNSIRHGRLDLAEELVSQWFEERNMDVRKMDDQFRAALMWVKVKRALDEGRAFFDRLCDENAELVNEIMVNHLVIASGEAENVDQVYENFGLHKMLNSDTAPSLRAQHHLIDALFKCREIPAALSAFALMRKNGVPDDITLAMVIRGLVLNNEVNIAYRVFMAIKRDGIEPNLRAYSSLLKVCGKKADRSTRKTSGVPADVLEAIGLSDADGVTTIPMNNSSHAYRLFQQMTTYHNPDLYTYTTLISCFAKENIGRAIGIFKHMCSEGLKPSVVTYTALMQGCSIFRSAEMALLVYQHMQAQDVTPNRLTWHYLLKALARSKVPKSEVDKIAKIARKAMQSTT